MSEDLILIARFVQNQAQGGPGSASAVVDDPDGRKGIPVSEGLLDLFCGLSGHFEHGSLLGRER